jgi:hypothetical protein
MISYLNDSKFKINQKLFELIYQDATSQEEKYSSANSGINFKEYEEDLKAAIRKITAFSQCEVNLFGAYSDYIEFKNKKIFLLEETLAEELLEYDTYLAGEKVKIEGHINAIKSKLAYLGGFKRSLVSAFVENFNNLLQLDSTKEYSLSINPKSGTCTLKRSKVDILNIRDIKISASSNGLPGRILEDRNTFLSNVLNSDPELYFEYYKKGNTALNLNLDIMLETEEVVNLVTLSVKQKYLGTNLIVKNIIYIKDDKSSKSLIDLVDMQNQEREIESYTHEGDLSIPHLPVKAKRIKIFLTSDETTLVEDVSYCAVALKSLEFKKITYADAGELSFIEKSLKDLSVTTLKGSVVSYPRNKKLFEYAISAEVEDSEPISIQDGVAILDENKTAVALNLSLKKPDDITSIYSDNSAYEKTVLSSRQYIFNRAIIPNSFVLKSNVENLMVCQTGFYPRSSDIRKAFNLGRSKEDLNKFLLPANFMELGLDKSDLQVYADNILCTQKASERLLEDDLNYFTDGEYIFLKDTSDLKNKLIKVIFKPKELTCILSNEDLFLAMKENFDKDLSTISLKSFAKTPKAQIENFQEQFDFIVLEQEFISNVKISNENSEDITTNFEVNNIKGTLYYKGDAPIEKLTVEYDYFHHVTLTPEAIWEDENLIRGISVNKNKAISNSFVQKLNEPIDTSNFLKDILNTKNDFSPKSLEGSRLRLKSNSILKGSVTLSLDFFDTDTRPREVGYIDGYSEFLNLTLIEREPFPLMETSRFGEVSFTLTKKPSALHPGIKIYDGNTELLDVEYALSERVITIQLSQATTRNLSISYFYEKKHATEELYSDYSVDYINGFLYTGSPLDLTSGNQLSYSSPLIVAEYSLCNPITSWQREGGVLKVDFSSTSKATNTVKIFWQEPKDLSLTSELLKYYSPIIYSMKVEMGGSK